MATGAPLPVREYTDAAEMLRRARELHRACFGAKGVAEAAPPPVVVTPPSDTAEDFLTARVKSTIAVYGIPDLRSPEQRAGTAAYGGRHCLLVAVAVTDVPAHIICGSKVSADISKARQITYWLMRRYAGKSTPKIGQMLDRDHSTVISGLKRVERAMKAMGMGLAETPEAMAEALWLAEWPKGGGPC